MKKFVNRQQLEFSSREAARSVYCGNEMTLCRVLGELKLYVRSCDVTMAPHLALDGFWEAWITLYVQNIVKPGWKVVNVGAAYGYYSMLCAALECEVTAFEPQRELADMIRYSAMANGLNTKLIVETLGVGDTLDELTLNTNKHWVGGASLQPPHAAPGLYEVGRHDVERSAAPTPRIVRVTTLDHHFLRMIDDDEGVDLFIIDTEGFEPEVMRGAKRLLGCSPNAIVVIEITPSWYKDAPAFVQSLRARWDINDINADGALVPISDEDLLKMPQSTVALIPRK